MDSKLRRAVKADAQKAVREKQEGKALRNATITKHYDAPVRYSFPEPGRVNMNTYFSLPKIFTTDDGSSQWGKSAMAVYPVLCGEADFEKNSWFQISQENIGVMAGISVPTVNNAIKELLDRKFQLTNDENGKSKTIRLLERKKVWSGPRQFWMYRAGFVRKDWQTPSNSFPFYKSVIEFGYWAKLLPRAKALYLAMRCVAEQNYELYRDIEHDERGFDWMTPYDEYLQIRKWDFAPLPLAELCRLMGMSDRKIKEPLKQLERYGLAERMDKGWIVYLRVEQRQFE